MCSALASQAKAEADKLKTEELEDMESLDLAAARRKSEVKFEEKSQLAAELADLQELDLADASRKSHAEYERRNSSTGLISANNLAGAA